jgi:hypothetical protein
MLKTFISAISLACLAIPLHAQQAGRVDLIDGEVRITNAKAQTRAPQLGEAINQGDTVTTGKNGEVHLKMDDGGMLALRADARLSIVKFQNKGRDGDGSLFSLARGALRAITGWIGRRAPDRVGILTPTATIGIRGTDHEVVVVAEDGGDGQAGTYDKVNAGGTIVSSERGTVDVLPGQAAFASPSAAPTVLTTIPDVFKSSRNDGRLEGLNDRLQRSPDTRGPIAPPPVGRGATGTPGAGAGTGKSNVQIQGNTRINASAKDSNAVAIGQDNDVSNKIGTIGGK